MQTFLISILIAAISSLAVLAFKQPKIYEKLVGVLSWGITIISAAILIWNLAISLTFSELISFIPSEKFAAAKTATEQFNVPSQWLFLSVLIAFAYVMFLSWLAHQIQHTQNTSNKDE